MNRRIILFSSLLLIVIIFIAGGWVFRKGININRESLKQTSQKESTIPVLNSSSSNLPEDFPSYKGAKISESSSNETDGAFGLSVVLESIDSPDTVFDFYKEKLPNSGWVIDNILESGDSRTLLFKKEDVSGFLGVIRAGDKTMISVTMGKARN